MTEDFHPEARSEFLETIQFYAERKEGLGEEFRDAMRDALNSIAADPLRYQRVKGEIRVFRLNRFPFYIYYEFMPTINSIWIWGVIHHRRRPDFWHDRLGN